MLDLLIKNGIVVFDPETIGSPERGSPVNDLPAGGARMYSKADGVAHVVVNGVELYRNGRHTGAYPGTVLRSGAWRGMRS